MREFIRNSAIVICLLAIAALSYTEYVAPQNRMPEWVEIQPGPVAHGFDKFYRSVYIKGNLTVAGDTIAKSSLVLTETTLSVITGTHTITPTAAYYKLEPWEDMTITLGVGQVGQPLIMQNANITTTWILTANLEPTTVITLGPNDVFMAICNGTHWLRMLHSDNYNY